MIDRDLLKLLGDDRKYIIYTVALMIAGLFANVSITACICCTVHLAINHGTEGSLAVFAWPAAGAAAAVAVRYVTTRLAGNIRDVLGRRAKRALREKVYDKILRLGVRSTDDMSMAGLTQVSMEGIEQLDLYYTSYIPQFCYAMAAPLILFGMTVLIDWRVALTLLACVPLIPLSIITISRYARRIFTKYWGKYTSMGDGFLDSVQGLKELKIFNSDERQHRRMNESSEEFRRITMKVLVMQLGSATVMDLVAYGGAGAGISLAIAGVTAGRLEPAAALFLILVAVEFFLPLRAFGSAFHIAMNGASAGRKILSLLEKPEPVWGEELPEKDAKPALCMRNVSFSYDGRREVLKNIDMTFPEAGMTAIVGESGCGKSTVVNLISGMISQTSGQILAGGKELRCLSRESWYDRLAVVSYNTYVFHDTVRENFLMARKNASDEEMYEALKKVRLADFIRESGGLDRVIAEDAADFSGGQKQRLALAVNLMADKDIYVFDEATSNIDIESEAVIMDNIRELARRKSVIVISHRLANVVSADSIYYMEKGAVMEKGAHDELMEAAGGYARLFNMQKRLEEGCGEVML